MRRQKNDMHSPSPGGHEQITALYGWTHKNEQMIASLSGRLAILETRLSLLVPESQPSLNREPIGPIQRCFINRDKNQDDPLAWAKVLDYDLAKTQVALQDHEGKIAMLSDQIIALGLTTEKTRPENIETQTTHTEPATKNISSGIWHKPPFLQKPRTHKTLLQTTSILLIILAVSITALTVLYQIEILANPLLLTCIVILVTASVIIRVVESRTKTRIHQADEDTSVQQTEQFDDSDEDRMPT